MKYPDHQAILDKIDELFVFRQLTALVQFADPALSPEWIGQLKTLQYAIYRLDAYLEGEWNLDPAERAHRWAEIELALAVLGITGKNAEKWLSEVRLYERIEKDCRRNRWPTRLGLKSFYTIKSCDVRLIRRLIYAASPSLASHWAPENWRFFDRISEIHDDVSDLSEDLESWNANRFLIALLRKGIPETRRTYQQFIHRTAQRAARTFLQYSSGDTNLQIAALTESMHTGTLHLLLDTLDNFDPGVLQRSWMLGKMK